MYGNEAEVGHAIAKSGLGRGEVFVTTKLNNGAHRPDDARRAFDGSQVREDSRAGDPALAHRAWRHRLSQIRHRMRENIDIFDFELAGEDVEAISALNRNQRTAPDPDKFDMI